MANYIDMGKKLYDTSNPREVRRMAAFVAKAIVHSSELSKLESFLCSECGIQEIIDKKPFPLEQVTRSFFYKGSTFKERILLTKEHFAFLSAKVQHDYLINMTGTFTGGYYIWENEINSDEGWQLKALIHFEAGQRKEGLSSVKLDLFKDGKYVAHLYQIMFWIAKDKEGKDSLYIGAMQGPNMENAKDVVKKMTKACHGYRTKNLVLYITQAVARTLGIERMYAVSNEGYYANNHIRLDRKLKTDFGAFWVEAGGAVTADSRFYSLPLVESRKTMEEVPTRKRAVYRRRFALLDSIDAEVSAAVRQAMR